MPRNAGTGSKPAISSVTAGSLHCALLLDTVVTRSSGWHMAFVFPTAGVIRLGLLVIGSGALAGLLPGMRAARLDVKTALATD